MRLRARPLAAVPAVLCALLATGCTSDDDPAATPSATAPSATATPAAEPTAKPTAAVTAPASAAPTRTPSETETERNDPGDGVAVDPPVAEPSPTAGSSTAKAEMVLTGWGASSSEYSATAIVEGVVDDGTCTLEMTRRGDVRKATGPSTRSADSSSCAQDLSIPLSELTAGTWMLHVSFDAGDVVGSTEPQEVEVP
ncbi:hypothetical protein [Demequina sp. NBRC 110053]|uniref:hypothetical protein n=1 Tax=Demequina sp. NBRC 110053 TaxID=1570342 RepID=UPI0009FE4478|nr:hypothetical protein [Demequina sp. NBRC 110053]